MIPVKRLLAAKQAAKTLPEDLTKEVVKKQ
jgi:hypothetical protein